MAIGEIVAGQIDRRGAAAQIFRLGQMLLPDLQHIRRKLWMIAQAFDDQARGGQITRRQTVGCHPKPGPQIAWSLQGRATQRDATPCSSDRSVGIKSPVAAMMRAFYNSDRQATTTGAAEIGQRVRVAFVLGNRRTLPG